MVVAEQFKPLFAQYVVDGDHGRSDYFGLIHSLVDMRRQNKTGAQDALDAAYALLYAEMRDNSGIPGKPISFGTSGWRGMLGKDIFARSVALVTTAIVRMYEQADTDEQLAGLLGISSLEEARTKGCVLGFDNRFGGELLAANVAAVLVRNGFNVHYAGESTTGVLSAAVLQLGAAFSINLTPSHNPLEYGGYKFNAADAGPAEAKVTERITANARKLVEENPEIVLVDGFSRQWNDSGLVQNFDSLQSWLELVGKNQEQHGLVLKQAVTDFLSRDDMVVVVDAVHGASRLHLRRLFQDTDNPALTLLRDEPDVTFGGVAPEPSSTNMQGVVEKLNACSERIKLGAIIDPDGDRIRFTDGQQEISMNQFGAMAYHFLHHHKGKVGIVAKTVATSNLANAVAQGMSEDVFEPAVGFKNFKPVIGKALVCFEESDGISVIGHTPEKDAYIGLLLALEMVLTTGLNLGDYLAAIEREFGAYYPARDGITVSVSGAELQTLLKGLEKYAVGDTVAIGTASRQIVQIITIDGTKIIFDDGSWLMIRPSGTEPKVRFYVESRTVQDVDALVAAAQKMLQEVGVL